MKNCCGSGSPRLMSYGTGGYNTYQTCLVPTHDKPCNISMKHPVCQIQTRPQEAECKMAPRALDVPKCPLAPININLQMRKEGPSDGSDSQSQQAYYGYPKEFFGCNTEEPEPRPRRCPDGNFVVKVEAFKPQSIFTPSTAPFYGLSSYKTHFEPKPIEKVKAYRPKATFTKSEGPLEGISLYKSEYVPHEVIPQKKPIWAKLAEFRPPKGNMFGPGQTTYNSAYTGSPGGPAQSAKRDRGYDSSKHPFDGSTTHKVDYIPFCNIERAKSYKPGAEAALINCAKFRGFTTYQTDFTPKAGGVRHSFKTRGVPPRSGKFSGETTYSVAYEPFYYVKCEPCVSPEVYDQMYPKYPCDCVNCCAPAKRNDAPVAPVLPCPRPQPCESQPTCEPAYKLTVKNEDCHFDQTLISIEPNPNCTPQLYF